MQQAKHSPWLTVSIGTELPSYVSHAASQVEHLFTSNMFCEPASFVDE
jgi:hypothetical protein